MSQVTLMLKVSPYEAVMIFGLLAKLRIDDPDRGARLEHLIGDAQMFLKEEADGAVQAWMNEMDPPCGEGPFSEAPPGKIGQEIDS